MSDAESTVKRLGDELEANRAMFAALCVTCRGERLAREAPPGGHWTVQDLLAHIASYDELAVGLLRGDGREVENALGMPDSATWNEAQVARRAGRTAEMLRDEMAILRGRSVGLLAQQTDPTLNAEIFTGDCRRAAGMIPLRLWLERWSRHDMVHGRWILSALPELAANADFQSWLADDPVLDALEREEGGG